ncbi:leucyl aminopeptidase [Halodesulfovibrio sp.]|jgi:leucyl aminopeptidase|uniref:leucyl aminopeptidase n=1 Tax=Halodesulfovibrio sp. TaxID=1912772 RepID=UPI0025FB4972|nr:leucyl aminopeptidase [Halodesulfovibrio sp.]MCT4536375.1 leucyl aminopeptidase [Halodesulfovibrio sp.]MCT4625572.1 leucyl aminopeptidase [Halodesulfovibrio sp.]
MNLRFQQAPAEEWQANTVLLFNFKGEEVTESIPNLRDSIPWITITPAIQDAKGEKNQVTVAYGHPSVPMPRAVIVGLGDRKSFTLEVLRDAVKTAALKCRELKADTCAIPVEALDTIEEENTVLVEEAVASALIALHTYDALKTTQKEPAHTPRWMALLSTEDFFPDDIHAAARRGEAAALGVNYTRDLVNAPANIITPSALAEKAEELGKKYNFKRTILGREEIIEAGMGAFMSVAAGSDADPKFIVMEHAPKGTENDDPIVFVGKGVTFDTGGISLKPSLNMHEMKCDMGGAGAVFGLFEALGNSDIERRVIGITPCTDNMPSSTATHPGDVVTSLNGKTIEVINTDAEGRLILVDALTYAQKEYKPSAIIDLATLTGACVVALGAHAAAVFATDDDLTKNIAETGSRVGDRYWPMPLWDFYFEAMKSDVADMKNVGTREGGTIHAALFLKQFIEEDVRWAHLDIAGPAYNSKGGATGFGVRTLLELVRSGV